MQKKIIEIFYLIKLRLQFMQVIKYQYNEKEKSDMLNVFLSMNEFE